MVAAGLTPYEALRTSTANPARFLGACQEFGTIAVGKRADLVLLEANPLKDISNTSKQAGVMLRGRWIPDAEIKKMQAQLLDSYSHMPLTLDLREIH
jgi:imidazolonepropionase-like amidohydrolase